VKLLFKIFDSIKLKIKKDVHLAELFKGGATSFITKIGGLIIGYIFSIVVVRTLGAESWGIYSLSLAIVTISGIFARFGFDTVLVRLNAEYKSLGKISSLIPLSKFVFKVSFIVSLIISIIVYLSAGLIANEIFNKPHLTGSIKIVSLAILPFSLSLVTSGALRGFKQISKAVFIDYAAKFVYMLLFLLIGFYFFNLNKESIVIIIVIASFAMFFQAAFWYWRELKKYNNEENIKVNWRTVVKIAFPLILASSALYLKGWIDTITIGIYNSEKEVGIYNIAQKLANFTIIPLVTINIIAAPKFAENKLNVEELKKVFRKTSKLIFLFSIPILIALILFSEPILKIFGDDFVQAKFVLIVVSFAAFINTIFGSLSYLLQMTGFQVEFQNSIIILCVLAIILNFFLVPIYGINGAAVSTLLVNFTWNVILILYVKKKLGFWTFKYN